MSGLVSVTHRVERLLFTVLLGLGAVMLTLSLIGLFGSMTERIRHSEMDLGVRLAVGASLVEIQGRLLLDVLRVTSIGAARGAAIALSVERGLATAQYDFDPLGLPGYVVVSGCVLLAAVGGSLLPSVA